MNHIVVLFCLSLSTVVLCEVCVPASHVVITADQSLTALGRKQLSATHNSTNRFYRTMIFDAAHNRLIVGSKDFILYLDPATLEVIRSIKWESSSTADCLSSGIIPEKYCSNFIVHLNIYKDRLLACGTGSSQPQYKLLSLTTSTEVPSSNSALNENICASPNPEHRVTGAFTNLGELVVGKSKDFNGKICEVTGNYVTEKVNNYRPELTTKKSKSIEEKTEFVNSVYIKDSVYVFFMESAEENNGYMHATVGRFCQTDNGGPIYFSRRMWTTFRKARLNCKFSDEMYYQFHNLVDIIYDDENQIFYAAFTMSKTKKIASAVCAFTLEDIDEAIAGDFLVKNKETKEWKELKNDGILDGCKVKKSALGTSILKVPYGKEPTNSMKFDASSFVSNNQLMATQINSNDGIIKFVKLVSQFSRISIDRISLPTRVNKTIVQVIDEDGKLLEIHQLDNVRSDNPTVDHQNEACIIEEIKTGLHLPKQLLMNQKNRVLYVSSDDDLHAYTIDGCSRHVSQSECVGAHDPRCGWSTNNQSCMSWKERITNNNTEWIQDLTKCPTRKDLFTAWTPWQPCKQGTGGRYCLCRERRCKTCNVALCGQESIIEVTNCTASVVEDIDKWQLEGTIDGSWAAWVEWSDCHETVCGNDTKVRYRTCSSPAPRNGGKNCEGNNYDCTVCPKKSEDNVFWSVWGAWSDCIEFSETDYHQIRTRQCSKPGKCQGSESSTQECVPNGTIWAEWSACTCAQSVRHRYPKFISGCKNCPEMEMAEYDYCKPIGCKEAGTGSNDTLSNNSTAEGGSNNIPEIKPEKTPIRDVPEQEYTFKLKDIIIIACGIVISCFVIVIFVVIFMRRREKKNLYSPTKMSKIKKKGGLLSADTDTLESGERTSAA